MYRRHASPLGIAAIAEAATGLALLLSPSTVVTLLFATTIGGAGVVGCRIAGLALIALGVACSRPQGRALAGMLTYNASVTVYLISLGLVGGWDGALLWPVVTIHAGLTVLLAREWRYDRDLPAGGVRRRRRVPDR